MTFLYLCLIVACLIYLNEKKTQRNNHAKEVLKKYPEYCGILHETMNRAYDIIFKDRIVVFSLEGMRVTESELDLISRDFVKLVLKFLGSNLQNELEVMYGNQETLFRNITEFFSSRFENDEIRKTALDNMLLRDQTIEDFN